MAEPFSQRGVTFVFVYTREAHPGERIPHHTSLEQKLAHARAFVDAFDIRRPMLVDDLDGPLHRAYGLLPNMTYIVNPRGQVAFRADWTDVYALQVALEYLLHEREVRRQGVRSAPFYAELLGHREIERDGFMRGLLRAGPKAVEEYIHANAVTRGEAVAKPLRDWWE